MTLGTLKLGKYGIMVQLGHATILASTVGIQKKIRILIGMP